MTPPVITLHLRSVMAHSKGGRSLLAAVAKKGPSLMRARGRARRPSVDEAIRATTVALGELPRQNGMELMAPLPMPSVHDEHVLNAEPAGEGLARRTADQFFSAAGPSRPRRGTGSARAMAKALGERV